MLASSESSGSRCWRRVATPTEQVIPLSDSGSGWMSPGPAQKVVPTMLGADLLRDVDRRLEVGAGEEEHELVAAVAGGDAADRP